MFRRNHTQPLKVVTAPEDDWSETTVNERKPEPRVTLADLHAMMGKLAGAVRWLAVTVGALTLVTILHLWVIW